MRIQPARRTVLYVTLAFLFLIVFFGGHFVSNIVTNLYAISVKNVVLGRVPCSIRLADSFGVSTSNLIESRNDIHNKWLNGMWELHCGNLSAAVDELQLLQAQEPENIMVATTLVETLAKLNLDQRALAIINEYPNESWRMYLKLADSAKASGNFARAISWMELALSRSQLISNENRITLYTEASTLYETAGRLDSAELAQEQLTALMPPNPSVWLRLGNLQFGNKKYSAAVDSYKNALVLKADPEWQKLLGLALGAASEEAGNPIDSVEVSEFPNDRWTLFVGGAIVASDKNDFERAAYLLDQTSNWLHLPASGEFFTLYSYDCRLYPRAGREEEAKLACEHMVQVAPTNPDAWGLLGDLYLNYTRDYALAISAYQTSLSLDPNNVIWRLHLGDAYLASGNFTGAQEEYEIILKSDPEYGWAKLGLASVFVKLGDVCSAAEQLRSALSSSDAIIVDHARQQFSNLETENCPVK